MNYSQKDKSSIIELFNKIAPKYDLLNNLMSFGFQKIIKNWAVKRTIKYYNGKPLRILDLCTGTGDIAHSFRKFLPQAQIIGVDFSEEMLAIARKRYQNVTFVQKDIFNLDELKLFPENCFDVCFISFGLRNLPDIEVFMDYIKKYINKNGVLAVLDLGKPSVETKWYFRFHYNCIIPLFAKLFTKNIQAYRYFIDSAKNYPSQQKIAELLREKGYADVLIQNYFFGIVSLQLAQINSHLR